MDSYWTRYLRERTLSRRAAMAGAAGITTSALALSLVGCGGDDEGGGDKSGLLTEPKAEADKAVRGGIIKDSINADMASLDPLGAGQNRDTSYAYSRLFQYKLGTRDAPPIGEVEPGAIASYETSADKLTITMKLDPNHKLDPRAPTNGRALDANDVAYTWKRFEAVSRSRGDLANSVSSDAVVISMNAIDKSTVQVKLAYELAPVLLYLGFFRYLPLIPVESESQFDMRGDTRGSGPWILDKYTRSVSAEWRRNPGWSAKPTGYLDGIDIHIIPEYAQALAQFKAKNLDLFIDLRPEDMITTKREHPQMVMQATSAFFEAGDMSAFAISGRDNSPFRDERVRRAMSMLIDRNLFIDVFGNVSGFEKEGIEVETRWHSHISSFRSAFWLNPQDNGLGEGAKYFELNPEEAAKLLRAAGKFGMEAQLTWNINGGPTPESGKYCEVVGGMIEKEGHFKAKLNPVDYTTVYTPNYTFAKGDFDGVAYLPAGTYPDIDAWLTAVWTVPGRNAWVKNPIPKVQDLIVAQRKEFDFKKRQQIINDMQKELALQMPGIPHPGVAQAFELYWPWVRNQGAYVPFIRTGHEASEIRTNWWIDNSKKTA